MAPLTVCGALGFSLGLRCCYFSTPLHIPFRLSRVQHMRLKRDDVGGAVLTLLHGHSLWLPSVCRGYVKVYLYRLGIVRWGYTMLTLGATVGLLRSAYWLTHQARCVRVCIPEEFALR
jgi:hypothetical protein